MNIRNLLFATFAAAPTAFAQNVLASSEMNTGLGAWDPIFKIPGSAPNASWDAASGAAYLPTFGVVSQYAAVGGRMVVLFRASAGMSYMGTPTVLLGRYTDYNGNILASRPVSLPTATPPNSSQIYRPGPWSNQVWMPNVPAGTSRLLFHNGGYDQAGYIDSVYAFPSNNNGPGKAAGVATVVEGTQLGGGSTPTQLQAALNGSNGLNFTGSLMVAAYPPTGGGTKVQVDAAAARSGSLGMSAYDFVNAKWVLLTTSAPIGPHVSVGTAYTTLTFPGVPSPAANFVSPESGMMLVSTWFYDVFGCFNCGIPPVPVAVALRNFIVLP